MDPIHVQLCDSIHSVYAGIVISFTYLILSSLATRRFAETLKREVVGEGDVRSVSRCTLHNINNRWKKQSLTGIMTELFHDLVYAKYFQIQHQKRRGSGALKAPPPATQNASWKFSGGGQK